MPEAKLTGEREGKVSVGKITGGEVIPEKTGEIPWDNAPKVGTEARKKFYNKYNLRYDDTIKGFNRDGSPKGGGKSKTGSGSDNTKFEPKLQGLKTGKKGKKGGKGKNLIDKISSKASHIDFSDWDRPIRDFFQDLASPK